MKYAVVKANSGQIKLVEGAKIKIFGYIEKPKLEVIFFTDGKESIMDPTALKDVKITLEVLGNSRSRKLKVGRYKAKSRYDKWRGYRDQLTDVLVSSIKIGNKSEPEEKEEPKTVSKKTEDKEKKPVKKPGKKLEKVA